MPDVSRSDTELSSKAARSALLGAVFLMATSAVGPGFITQTTDFTVQLGAAFIFAILVSIVIDIAVQLNVWRVIGVSGRRAQELGNAVAPGLGYALAALVVLGGLVFNIGNVAGTGLGANAMTDIDAKVGGAVSAGIAIAIFLSKWAGVALDRIVVFLGLVMVALTAYVAITSDPPVGDVLHNAVAPDEIDFFVIVTVIGGTVGGYITYAGAHRMLDSGISGSENVLRITRSSIVSIVVTGVMRLLLFLAILGVVAGGATLAEANPTASAFDAAIGEAGLRLFGVIFWSAAVTSVIGASFTSVSFMTSSSTSQRTRNLLTVGFIGLSAVIYLLVGTAPVKLLIFAGAFNGLILPVGFAVLLWVAWRRPDLMNGYRYPRWLLTIGFATWLLTVYIGWQALEGLADL